MQKAFRWNNRVVLLVAGLLNMLSIGMGMGVPFFTILLGFPLGWYFARRADLAGGGAVPAMRRVLRWSGFVMLFSVVILAVIWLPTARMLFDPAADLANFGIPMILYGPKASFIGWIVLMVLVSPLLQGLAALGAAYITFMRLWRSR